MELLLAARTASHYAATTTGAVATVLTRLNSVLPMHHLRQQQRNAASSASPPTAQASPSSPKDAVTPNDLAAKQQVGSKDNLIPASVVQALQPPSRPYTILSGVAQRPCPTPAQYAPWTPTRMLQRRAKLKRRMRFLVGVVEQEKVLQAESARPLPAFRAGDILEVRMLVPEVDRKEVMYRGVCIARYDAGLRSAFKFYNVFPESGGVVQHVPLYMPDLLSVKVVGRVPATQERLYYMLENETRDHSYQSAVGAKS